MPEVVPLNESGLHRAVNLMLLSFPSSEKTTALRIARINAYVEALSSIPIVFAKAACAAAANGRLNDGKWLPNAGELRQYAIALQERALKGKTPSRRMVAVPWPSREPEEFDPKAKQFSPYKLGLTKEAIIAKLQET